jgi:hypothetical protein
MSDQLMNFSDQVGQELYQLLAKRGLEGLANESGYDRFTALLGAALIPIAEVLRGPIEQSKDRERMANQMIEISSRQLYGLLESVIKDKKA